MDSKNDNFRMHNKSILLVALAVGLILLVPLVAMQFSEAVDWSAFDFAFAGALLFGTGLAFVLIAGKSAVLAYRAAVGIALAAALLLVWVNLAVGIIGSEDNPLNGMYLGVLAVFVIGALLARFRPNGMVRAMLATALAQIIVTAIALLVGQGLEVIEILAVNGFFAALWAGSAWLFRVAARSRQAE